MKKINKFITIGIVGIIILVLLNMFSNFILKQPAATPFQPDWFATWFPGYIVWFVILTAGIAQPGK